MENLKTFEEQLKKERRKLNILISRALRGPIVAHQDILDQSQTVDKLIEQIQLEKENPNKEKRNT